MTLLYIVIASLAGGVVSALFAATVAWRLQPRLIPLFVSFAVGALLGVVFLDIMPHIFEHSGKSHDTAAWILAGILGFFVLEKLVLWRHNHDHAGQAEAAAAAHAEAHKHPHDHAHGHVHGHGHAHHHEETGRASSAWMIIIGDGFHNFTDGFAIAAAFMADTRLGILTALAIVAHELPQELGDFLVLLNSGFSKARALMWNLISSLATLVGAMIAYFVLRGLEEYALVFLCFAASSMIYVAIADLIPGLHRKTALKDSLLQILLIGVGVFSIWIFRLLMAH
ncbi:MAG: ZIP family metal transporter [Betaproteobacteria bacterium]|nr:ZIP family metal transporter [Betaproteobacteria bacterium]